MPMRDQRAPRPSPARHGPGEAGLQPTADSEITWLLHRAAQRMRAATSQIAQEHGVELRDYIVLSALEASPSQTQIELGRSLGLDKTTLMSSLDRLEGQGLVIRRADPRDRRARIPEITAAGGALRSTVARACARAEAAALNGASESSVRTLRRLLADLIGDGQDPGSCL